MKIAISATGPNLDDTVEARFGRCPYFLVVDPATLEFEALPNPNRGLGGGAGIQSAKLMTEKDVSVVLTGSCGPNAMQVLEKGGIKVVTGVSGSVREVVQQFSAGSLKTATAAQSAGRFARRTGRRMDRSMAGGRGMGGGGRLR
jgi:predicted Fe-Mo cluster-binding NifX family protein